jgi:manganese transport system ATP-binding protein
MPLDTPVIRGRDIEVGYQGKVALEASSFEIPFGVLTAVIGPNGSGKSTLLNTIAGLTSPASGEVSLPPDRDRVAYVMQSTKVSDSLPISVREVVTMGRYPGTGPYRRLGPDDRRAVADAMQRVGITSLAQEHLGRLSGGQRQRAFVAQGLAQDHDILLLDEPLTGIDIPTALAIDEVIHEEIEDGCAVVMTTHDLSEASVAAHVILLSGRVVASGPPETVLTTENLRLAYGTSLIHFDEGGLLLDDAAHNPVGGRHLHRDRVIHTEMDPEELHGG